MQEEEGTQEEASGLLIQVAADVENNFGGQFCPDIADHFVVLVTLIISSVGAAKSFLEQFCPDHSSNNKIDK